MKEAGGCRAIRFGLFNGDVDGIVRGDLAKAAAAIDHCHDTGFARDHGVGRRVDHTIVDVGQILHGADHTVRIMTGQVGTDE